jgi:uncharacterized membrane protein YczE
MNFQGLIAHLKPHRTVPNTPWRASNRWDLSLGRVGILFSGLLLFGFGDALVVQSNLGNAPWTIFAEGVSKKTSLSLGVSTLVISAAVMLLWIPLKEVPGFGTFANAILIAFGIQFGVDHFPLQQNFYAGVASALLGVALVGFGTSLYITCALGPGPRDGAMTGLHRVTGVRIGRVRLGIEITVAAIGVALGGRFGLGTAIFALGVGQSIAIFLGVIARLTSK